MNNLREFTQELEHILTYSRQYIRDLGTSSDALHQLIAFGGLPTNIAFQDTSFCKHLKPNIRGETDAIKIVIEASVRERHENI